MTELSTQYTPAEIESATTRRWLETGAFAAHPDERDDRYVIMMPLPNVTGALHMGHAMDNVMQDVLTRWRRMSGDNALWMAGTDHAGIATQSVVEKRILQLEGKSRHDLGRDELVRRIWQWKDQYQQRIVEQQQAMGCSCDWDRQRFTMDEMCARAVRQTFFKMFRDGLIYQGDRLVHWDCELRTAVADDELYTETVQGKFWHLRYPVIDPKPGEPSHIVVATTRPETMLGDTAVACHGDPATAIDRAIRKTEERLQKAPGKDRPHIEAELKRLHERKQTHLPKLEQIAAMGRDGRKVRLPLLDRELPILCDEWAKPELGSGCVKITPAHDPNDYEVQSRHPDTVQILNILREDGTLNEVAGPYAGMDRFDARKRVTADLDAAGLLAEVEDRDVEIKFSDRSKSIVEPYVSKQWFVRMGDIDGGILLGAGTDKEFRAPGLAQAAIDAASKDWKSATGRSVTFHPDGDRYHKIFHAWLVEKRDWCISRQLWWGHRIPVWRGTLNRNALLQIEGPVLGMAAQEGVAAWVSFEDGQRLEPAEAFRRLEGDKSIDRVDVQVCFLDPQKDELIGPILESGGLQLDPDVLDTWFSSALWPHSTLGWPDPETAPVRDGQSTTASQDGHANALDYYYPGSCLVTGRDIISLWVARMVMVGLYNLGDVPFTDVFLHATILDGKGERMSKSKGNGIDPLDIIERYGTDAMRFVLCEMQTGTQDIRLPVQAISPFDGEPIDMAKAKAVQGKQGVFLDPRSGKEFDVVGLYESEGVPGAKAISDRFEVGRNFCNKVWNAARFAFLNLTGTTFVARGHDRLEVEDRWILSRLAATVGDVQQALTEFAPATAIGAARDFFWNDVCDVYLEMVKPRMADDAAAPQARQVFAAVMDQILRLLHPFVPFLTEELWRNLGTLAPERGIDEPFAAAEMCCHAPWPQSRDDWRDAALETQMELIREVARSIRETRARYQVQQRTPVPVRIRASGTSAEALVACSKLLGQMVNATTLEIDANACKTDDAATIALRDFEIYVLGIVDPAEEAKKIAKLVAKLDQQIASLEKKLGNEGFVAKAPAAVVAKERAALAELHKQRGALA